MKHIKYYDIYYYLNYSTVHQIGGDGARVVTATTLSRGEVLAHSDLHIWTVG
jgi:hypothetical protein